MSKERFAGVDKVDVKKKIPALITDCRGFITTMCQKVGISRTTYYNWKNEDEEFAKACNEAEADAHEALGDFAEGMLFKNIQAGKESSIFFYLKTRHKARGYVERTELTAKDGDKLIEQSPAILAIDSRIGELLNRGKEANNTAPMPN